MAQPSLTSTLVPVAQVVGITGSAMLSGLIGAMSYVSIPTLRELPAPLAAKVWKRTYDIGIATAPPIAITSAVCFGFLAREAPATSIFGSTNSRALYAAAGILIPSIVPYTLALMKPTNEKLMAKAREEAGKDDSETRELLERWRVLNFGRAALVLVGSLVGGVATVLR